MTKEKTNSAVTIGFGQGNTQGLPKPFVNRRAPHVEVFNRLRQFSQTVKALAAKLPSRSGWELWVLVIGMLFAAG